MICENAEMIELFLKNGADVDCVEESGNIPLIFLEKTTDSYLTCVREILIHVSVKLFEQCSLCSKLINFINEDINCRSILTECTSELNLMRKTVFYAPFSYYDIFKNLHKKKK